ncbi:tetratricopeptide repeat protein [Nocardia sp. NPDC020380]|uniref:tetratricopeptide repeat protein n=1 Tax=Nocardia sp. NPDC020380 TaxID=3364309 RepID=UPI0037BB0C13
MSEFHAQDNAEQVNVAGDNTGTINVTAIHRAAPPPRPVVISALRRNVSNFVDREREILQILDAVRPDRRESIYTIDGMPGVGKTALATRAAHALAEQFPDGHYFVELHAHTPGHAPANPSDVLARLLACLGVDPRILPESLEARRDMWRDRVGDKRVLLVLDDASGADQIEPLIPSGRHCLTLVTSRRRLLAFDDALPLALDILEPRRAAELFISLTRRLAISMEEQAAVEQIVGLCGYLPLAIVLLAGRLAHHPTWTIAVLAEDFAATRDRLDALALGERAVYAAFAMSYQDLPPQRQQLFRRIGLHPGVDVDAYAAAALGDIPLSNARRELEALYADHLLDETTPGRYRVHDLLRDYARALLSADDPDIRDRAVDRLIEYYQRTATKAAHDVRITRTVVSPIAETDEVVRHLPDRVFHSAPEALKWLRTERPNMLACLDYAARQQSSPAMVITSILANLFELDGPWSEALRLYQRAVISATNLGDRLGQARALHDLGVAHQLTGSYSAAAEFLEPALAIFRELDDRAGEADVRRDLALVRYRTGDYPLAVALLGDALTIYRDLGNRAGEADGLQDLGWVRERMADIPGASSAWTQALAIYRDLDDRRGEAAALQDVGWVRLYVGELPAAAEVLNQALAIYREIGPRSREGTALHDLGWVRQRSGDYPAATELFQQALTIHRALGNRVDEAAALRGLGMVQRRTGDYSSAAGTWAQSLAIHSEIGHRLGVANLLINLGWARQQSGDTSTAVEMLQEALTIHRQIGHRTGEAEALNNLGLTYGHSGDRSTASNSLQQSLDIYREIGNRNGETEVLNDLATLAMNAHDLDTASTRFSDALRLAHDVHSPFEEARAHEGIARCRIESGDFGGGVTELQEAIEIFRRIKVPEANPAAAYLATLEP